MKAMNNLISRYHLEILTKINNLIISNKRNWKAKITNGIQMSSTLKISSNMSNNLSVIKKQTILL